MGQYLGEGCREEGLQRSDLSRARDLKVFGLRTRQLHGGATKALKPSLDGLDAELQAPKELVDDLQMQRFPLMDDAIPLTCWAPPGPRPQQDLRTVDGH